MPIKILRTLHARASGGPQTLRGLWIPSKIIRTLRARASGGAANTERVADSEQNSQDAPRKSVRRRRKHGEGCGFRSKFSECSTQERPEAPQTRRGLWIPSKSPRMLHVRASGYAALRTGVGPWENEALAWGVFTFEYFDLF